MGYEEELQKWRDKTHGQYIAIRAAMDDKYYKSATELGKTLVMLSAGTLALSMTLVKDIFKVPVAVGWLRVSWIAFGVAILLVVAGSHLEALALRRQIQITDDYYERVQKCNPGVVVEPKKNKWMKATLQLGHASWGVFVAGYILMGVFVLKNL